MAIHRADDPSFPTPLSDDEPANRFGASECNDISIEQAADSILRAQLLDDTALSEARRELREVGTPLDGVQLLAHLTKTGRLTSFQIHWCDKFS